MTWQQYTDSLRAVRDRGQLSDDATQAHLLAQGLIAGCQRDAAGFVLTPKGRERLEQIEQDSRELDLMLVRLARVYGSGGVA